eukprot:3265497-Rhodomonas_salina.2
MHAGCKAIYTPAVAFLRYPGEPGTRVPGYPGTHTHVYAATNSNTMPLPHQAYWPVYTAGPSLG